MLIRPAQTKNNGWFQFDGRRVAYNEIGTLNVAGPTATKKPEVGEFVMGFLMEAFPACCDIRDLTLPTGVCILKVRLHPGLNRLAVEQFSPFKGCALTGVHSLANKAEFYLR